MKSPTIVALMPTGKNHIVKAVVVHAETGEVLARREYVMVDIYEASAIDRVVLDIEQRVPVYIRKLSLPTRRELDK
ncbi:hypothetical protein HNQ85_000245 [Anoxybacillus calidus]|uniref:Uncharacterized protein n=1 Tax=[Anoxybacillus] calidus TaxID=575178 RepID=A0A7V9YWX2_9BACL|nr:hypothetical protein [Anoxybacillus calidus]MBA2869987.1 hypothetical protein [Anoxybacillus calidus]